MWINMLKIGKKVLETFFDVSRSQEIRDVSHGHGYKLFISFLFLIFFFSFPGTKASSQGTKSHFPIACVAGARKGKGYQNRRARARSDARVGVTEAPAANPLFIWSFSFARERKIAIGSFLIMRQSLPGTTF